MKCPVCGKYVAEERYELHVGRHSDAGGGPAAAADEHESVDDTDDTDVADDTDDTDDELLDEEAAPESMPAAPASGPAGVRPGGTRDSSETVRSMPVAPSPAIDAGALLLGPEGTAAPLTDADATDDGDAPVVDAPEGEADVPADEAPPEERGRWNEEPAGSAAAWTEDEPLEPTAPIDVAPTTPLDVEESPPAWVGGPAPAGPAPPPRGGPHRLAPFPGGPVAGRRSRLPLLGLLALVILAAVVVFALLANDDDDGRDVRASRATTSTTPTTTRFGSLGPTATFGVTTIPTPQITLPAQPVPQQVPPVPAGGGVAAPPPGAGAGDPRAAIQVQAQRADCDNQRLTVTGTVVNQGASRYNVQFSVTVTNASGTPLGTARASVAGLGPGERRAFQAVGSCSGPLGPGDGATPQVESVTPA